MGKLIDVSRSGLATSGARETGKCLTRAYRASMRLAGRYVVEIARAVTTAMGAGRR